MSRSCNNSVSIQASVLTGRYQFSGVADFGFPYFTRVSAGGTQWKGKPERTYTHHYIASHGLLCVQLVFLSGLAIRYTYYYWKAWQKIYSTFSWRPFVGSCLMIIWPLTTAFLYIELLLVRKILRLLSNTHITYPRSNHPTRHGET